MDIKLVEHANDYIKKMAQGINPLTGEEVGNDDLINNIKISRCLFYVSEVLEDVIHGRATKPKKESVPQFDIDIEELAKFRYSEFPITISEIANRINELRKDENSKKFNCTKITAWLVDTGMLSVIEIKGKKHKRPTANGEAIGISCEKKQGQYGEYYAVFYNEDAQHFIIDNFEGILDYSRSNG